jgi:hypothetical protein
MPDADKFNFLAQALLNNFWQGLWEYYKVCFSLTLPAPP